MECSTLASRSYGTIELINWFEYIALNSSWNTHEVEFLDVDQPCSELTDWCTSRYKLGGTGHDSYPTQLTDIMMFSLF
jgi:hypothetical protein